MAALCRNVPLVARLMNRLSLSVTAKRNLLSGEILGLDSFSRIRFQVASRLGNDRDRFVKQMQELATQDDGRAVGLEDLKSLVHTAESDEEVEALVSLVRRYAKGQVDPGSIERQFHFGPLLLRMLYLTNRVDLAKSVFEDKSLERVFSPLVCRRLLMDLLYNSGRFQEVVDLYLQLLQENKAPYNCNSLYIASLYQLNTEESLNLALEAIRQSKLGSGKFAVRDFVFAAALAVNQNELSTALAICSNVVNPRMISVQNLKTICNCKLGKLEDNIQFLTWIIKDESEFSQYRIFPETVDALEEAAEKCENIDIKTETQSMLKALRSAGLIRQDSLKDYVEKPIQAAPVRDSFKTRRRSLIDGATSRGPGNRPGYRYSGSF